MTAVLSVDGDQLRLMCDVEIAVAERLVGMDGAVVSVTGGGGGVVVVVVVQLVQYSNAPMSYPVPWGREMPK